MGFKERLIKAREYRRMSQVELATRARLQPSAINHFEKGRREPSLKNLCALSFALSVSTDFLVGMGTGEIKELSVLREGEMQVPDGYFFVDDLDGGRLVKKQDGYVAQASVET